MSEQYWTKWKAETQAKNCKAHAAHLLNSAPPLSAKRLGQRGIINANAPALRYAALAFGTEPNPHDGFMLWLGNGASYSGLDQAA